MARRQLEERVEGTEREILSIKEAIVTLGKNMEKAIEQLMLEVRENKRDTLLSKGESSMVDEGSSQKLKNDIDEVRLDQSLVRRDSMGPVQPMEAGDASVYRR